MDPIERAAFASVGRACGFVGLGIVCVMSGLAYEPLLAAKIGAAATFVLMLVLGFRAKTAPQRPYRRTEAWLILDDADRPPATVAQRLLGEGLSLAYVWYARQTAVVTIVLTVAAIGLELVTPRAAG